MPLCTLPSSWGVTLTPEGGTISCGSLRGRFTVSRIGVVKIIWQDGPEPKDAGVIERAAQEAIERAMG